MTPDATAQLDVPRGNVIAGDPRSRGDATVAEAAHPRIGYRAELDGIRGIAILLVMAAHLEIAGFAGGGAAGVALFFVLSGYLITSLLIAELDSTGAISLRGFYERRVRRLLPALLACVLVFIPLHALNGTLGSYMAEALAVVTYGASIINALGTELPTMNWTWTLSVEELFYLVWPATVLLLASRRAWLVRIAYLGILGSVLFRLASPRLEPYIFGPFARADEVLWGCALALLPPRLPFRLPIVIAGWALVAIETAAAPDAFTAGLTIAAIASAFLVVSARPGWLSWRPIVRTGQISYGLYLWSMVAMYTGRTWFDWLPGIVPLIIIASFGLALASERWIEKPFRRRRQRDLPLTAPVATAA